MARGKTDIWMPVYIGDYLADTMHLTTEQHGAYFLLIMAYWKNKGPLLESRIKSIARIDEGGLAVVGEFFDTTSQPGKWVHGRIEKELELSIRIKEVRSEAGKTGGGNPHFQKGKQNPYYKDRQTDKQKDKQKINPSPSPSPSQSHIQAQQKKGLVLEKLKDVMGLYPDMRYQHNIQEFVKANWNKNDRAILLCLDRLANSKEPIKYPKSYLEKILAVENGNFNERESVQEHEEHKKPIQIDNIRGLNNVLKSMEAI